MSAALVRKALEISDPITPDVKGKKLTGNKILKKKKKTSAQKILKQNLKLLKSLESSLPNPVTAKVAKKKAKSKTAFTEEDFQKFESISLFTLAIILFGAPFLPPLKPFAVPVLVVLSALGSVFVLSVMFMAVYLVYEQT